MAEIASGVMHNVNNVLTSINIASTLVTESIKHALRGQDVVGDHEISDQRGTFF